MGSFLIRSNRLTDGTKALGSFIIQKGDNSYYCYFGFCHVGDKDRHDCIPLIEHYYLCIYAFCKKNCSMLYFC